MQSVYRDYIRARTYRKRKAIIYSVCAGIASLLFGLNIIQTLLVWTLTFMVTWGLCTRLVRSHRQIHLPGARK